MKKKNTLKLMIPLLIVSMLCIVLKLLISYLFPLSRLLLSVFFPVLLILLIVFLAKAEKILVKRVLICSMIAVVSVIFAVLPIDRQLELARFHVSKEAYSTAARQVQKSVAASGDTVSGRYSLKYPQSMLNPTVGGYVSYYKKGNSTAVLFPVSESLSIVRYFAYFSDPEARSLLERPKKKPSDSVPYDRIEELDGWQWAYVFSWGDDMPPKDPNL